MTPGTMTDVPDTRYAAHATRSSRVPGHRNRRADDPLDVRHDHARRGAVGGALPRPPQPPARCARAGRDPRPTRHGRVRPVAGPASDARGGVTRITSPCSTRWAWIGAHRRTLHGVPPAVTAAALIPTASRSWCSSVATSGSFAAPMTPKASIPDPRPVPRDVHAVVGHGPASSMVYGVEPDEHELPLYARLERAAAAPGSIERLLRWITSTDARARLRWCVLRHSSSASRRGS